MPYIETDRKCMLLKHIITLFVPNYLPTAHLNTAATDCNKD